MASRECQPGIRSGVGEPRANRSEVSREWLTDSRAERISTLLEPAGQVDGDPIRLAENIGIAFIGCYVLGMGFTLQPDEAEAWIRADPRNAEVLFPYLNGEDLNSRPDASASRWVIDFNDRPKRRQEHIDCHMSISRRRSGLSVSDEANGIRAATSSATLVAVRRKAACNAQGNRRS